MAPASSSVNPNLIEPTEQIKSSLETMQSRSDVAALLEIPVQLLSLILYKNKEREKYDTFTIPKKNGGKRTIDSPPANLKILQHKLNHALRLIYKESWSAHGFVKDRSIVTNARRHVHARWILNLDLEDFFHSIHLGRIKGALQLPPFNFGDEAALVVAQIATRHDGVLPQGSPLSPLISNIVAFGLDKSMVRLAAAVKAVYTRYADDITFSVRRKAFPSSLATGYGWKAVLSDQLQDAIATEKFQINLNKVRLYQRSDRLEVTGLVVNEYVNVDRKYIRHTRTLINLLRQHGEHGANQIYQSWPTSSASIKNALRGRLAFLSMVKGSNDPIYRRLATQAAELVPQSGISVKPLVDVTSAPLRSSKDGKWPIEEIGKLASKTVVQLKLKVGDDPYVGSAFFVSPCQLATAGHNCEADAIYMLDDEWNEIPLTVVDHVNMPGKLDIGLLQISVPYEHNKCWLRTQYRLPELGEELVAAGYPTVALRQTSLSVMSGIVESVPASACQSWRFIQIGLHSPGGLSGGPVFDRRGIVVGVMVENAFGLYLTKKQNEESNKIPDKAFGQATPIEYLEELRRRRLSKPSTSQYHPQILSTSEE